MKQQIGFYVYIHHSREFFLSGEEARDRYKFSGWKLTKVFADDSEELIKSKGGKNHGN